MLERRHFELDPLMDDAAALLDAEDRIHTLREACYMFDHSEHAYEDVSILKAVDFLLKSGARVRRTFPLELVTDRQSCYARSIWIWWQMYDGRRAFTAGSLIGNNVLADSLTEHQIKSADIVGRRLQGAARK